MKKNTLICFIFTFAMSACGNALAQTEVPNTFEAGQPAKAAEVNENFAATSSAIDAVAAASAANEAGIQENSTAITNLVPKDVRILDTCTITEPGNYALDRNWIGTEYSPPNDCPGPVTIRLPTGSDRVTLDLRGYQIHDSQDLSNVTAMVIESGVVTLRNGTISSSDLGVLAWAGTEVRLENLRTNAFLAGENSYVTDSQFSSGLEEAGLFVKDYSVVRNSICHGGGDVPCLIATGEGLEIVNNKFFARFSPTGSIKEGAMFLELSNSVVANNVIENLNFGIRTSASGGNNVVKNNIIRTAPDFLGRAGILVGGSGNIIDGNVVLGGGIKFTETGNFYGNNRVTTGFTGTAGQTDWGGNVSF